MTEEAVGSESDALLSSACMLIYVPRAVPEGNIAVSLAALSPSLAAESLDATINQ